MRRFWMIGALSVALFSLTPATAQTTTDPLGGATDEGGTDPADPGAGESDATGPVTDPSGAPTDEAATTASEESFVPPATDPLGGSTDTGAAAAAATTPEPVVEEEGPPEPVDRSGSFGLGVEGTMGFRLAPSEFIDSHQTVRLPALSLVYPASPLFNFQLLAGAILALGSGAPASVQLGVTLRGIYLGLILSRSVTLTIPFGLGYTISITPGFVQGESNTGHYFHLEAGLRPEWFVTEYFSVHTQAGAVISLLTGGQSVSGAPSYDPGVGLNLFANTNLMAQAGFTVWFN